MFAQIMTAAHRMRLLYARTCYFLFTGTTPPPDIKLLARFLTDTFETPTELRWERVILGYEELPEQARVVVQRTIDERLRSEQGQETLQRLRDEQFRAFLNTATLTNQPDNPDEEVLDGLEARLESIGSSYSTYADAVERAVKVKNLNEGPKRGRGRPKIPKPPASAHLAEESAKRPGNTVEPSRTAASSPTLVPDISDPSLQRRMEEVAASKQPVDPEVVRRRREFLEAFFSLTGVNVSFDLSSAVFLLARRSGQDRALLEQLARGEGAISQQACQSMKKQLGDHFSALDFTVWSSR